mmetsp:Transcript_5524/g.4336  ORF Transcript_5524/g.4336 Transcript_5524/m.4336 type:complete len:96 (+) Transcript_5524:75-362(+)
MHWMNIFATLAGSRPACGTQRTSVHIQARVDTGQRHCDKASGVHQLLSGATAAKPLARKRRASHTSSCRARSIDTCAQVARPATQTYCLKQYVTK